MLVLRKAHRKWEEIKQQPGTAEPSNMLGCCLNSFHFLWAILSTSTVQVAVVVVITGQIEARITLTLTGTEGNWLPFCHRGKRKQDQLHSTSLPALQFVVVNFISYPL